MGLSVVGPLRGFLLKAGVGVSGLEVLWRLSQFFSNIYRSFVSRVFTKGVLQGFCMTKEGFIRGLSSLGHAWAA